jgi:DNA-binding SARP family transcriptional activator
MTDDPAAPALTLAHAPAVRAPGRESLALGAREGVMLAWLALEGPTPRARLAQLLWPDSEPEAARNALRQRLFQLRKQVGGELIIGTHTLALAAGVSHDLQDADTVLGNNSDTLGPELATWLATQRERRLVRMRQSLIELADLAEAARDYADALSHASELLNLQPLSEEAHRRVMRLHYLAGDRAAALLAFDRCEQVLKDEVGARPSPETLALLATIEQQHTPHGPAAGGAVPASVQRPPRLIGRDAELAALVQGWQAGQVTAVCGEAGLGWCMWRRGRVTPVCRSPPWRGCCAR